MTSVRVWLKGWTGGSAEPTGGRGLIGLVLAIVVFCLLFSAWLTVPVWTVRQLPGTASGPHWIEAASTGYTRRTIETERIAAPSWRDVFVLSGYRQYTVEFDNTGQLGGALTVYAPVAPGNVRAFINRVPQGDIGDPRRVASSIGLARPVEVRTEPADFQPALNRIDLLVDASGSLAWPRSIIIAPAEAVAQAVLRQRALDQLLPRLSSLVGGAGLVVCFLALLLARAWRHLGMLVVLGLLTAGNALPLAVEAGVAEPVTAWLSLLSGAGLALACGHAAARLAGGRNSGQILALGLAPAVAAGAIVLLNPPEARGAMETAGAIGLTLLGTLYGLVWIGWACRKPLAAPSAIGDWMRASLAAVGVLVVVALICRLSLVPPLASVTLEVSHAILSLFLLTVGVVVGAVSLSSGLLHAWARRRSLAAIVRAQQALILEKDVIIGQEAERRAVLEERERLTRDIHDGIGGQLLSLLMQIRSGSIGPKDIEIRIEDGLNDLRLIITSLDHDAASLADTLSVAHARLRHQVEGADKRLDWTEIAPISDRLTPDQVLNLLRVLQEAVTNAVRHADASAVRVEIGGAGGGYQLQAIIRDDGTGFDPLAASTGMGLGNIRRRAASMGAELSIGSGPEGRGTEVRLTLPWP